MIRHYFCEYCGKDFLSEDECAKHEAECEVRIKKERERENNLEKVICSIEEASEGIWGAVDDLIQYILNYKISNPSEIFNEIKDKIKFADIVEEYFKKIDFDPVDFIFYILKINDEKATRIQVNSNIICDEIDKIYKNKEVKKANETNELDKLIDKLSEPSLFVTHDDKEPEDMVTYYFNGKEVSEKEFAKECAKLLPPSKRKEFEKECGLFYDEEYL